MPPRFGFLLDVDGPICSPIDRAITEPSIVDSLLTLAEAGQPVVFNTGRSADFVREAVFDPLSKAGLPLGARIHAVGEKGGVWFSLHPDGCSQVSIDTQITVPPGFAADVAALIAERYSDTTFFDTTKVAMVSTEQRIDVTSEVYYEEQARFCEDAFALLADRGEGVVMNDRVHGKPRYRIEPTIISTDIESILLGKDRGARRALDLLRQDGEMPSEWRTLGDSPSDYAMAQWLFDQGHKVKHIDVRPVSETERSYPVLRARKLENDLAGAAYLRWAAASLGANVEDESGYEEA